MSQASRSSEQNTLGLWVPSSRLQLLMLIGGASPFSSMNPNELEVQGTGLYCRFSIPFAAHNVYRLSHAQEQNNYYCVLADTVVCNFPNSIFPELISVFIDKLVFFI